ncbi:MAG: hypothetical protein H0X65_19705 [Gemmatimonadetes bacterium]|nr:hypothetical protein [Gemmatimonadota bacterium]
MRQAIRDLEARLLDSGQILRIYRMVIVNLSYSVVVEPVSRVEHEAVLNNASYAPCSPG